MITAGLRVSIFQLKVPVVERWLCDSGYHRLGLSPSPPSQPCRRENSGMTAAPLPPVIVSVQNFDYIAIDQSICGEYR